MMRAVAASLFAVALSGCADSTRDCRFWETGVAVTRQTPSGEPVMFVHHVCSRAAGGIEIRTSYVDLHGEQWTESELEAGKAFGAGSANPEMTEEEIVDRSADYRALIARYAICNGIVPKPAWFDGDCD